LIAGSNADAVKRDLHREQLARMKAESEIAECKARISAVEGDR
jgi:hypothetical protein